MIVNLFHPRRAAIGEDLARAIPLPPNDDESRAERRLLRRMDLAEAVRRP